MTTASYPSSRLEQVARRLLRRLPAAGTPYWYAATVAVLLALLLVAGAAVWVRLVGTSTPHAGSCLHRASGNQVTSSPCSSDRANLRVISRFDGVDTNRCDEVPGTTTAIVEYSHGNAPFVLCAGTYQG
jgi:hypothetical protein